MYTDLLGKKRLKINLHTHTTLSDGHCTPEETVDFYLAQGYDMVALTDHWKYGEERNIHGLHIISGCEYNVGGGNAENVVFHIVGIGMKEDPEISKTYEREHPEQNSYENAAYIISKIHGAGGLANLAHPAWSLDTPEMMMRIPGGYDVTEVYNSVSDFGMSDRAYSDLIIDQLAVAGRITPIMAVDDTHYCTGDQCRGWIMLDADAYEEKGLVKAIQDGHFYSSMGPEIHLERVDRNKVLLRCSPCSKIEFMSNRTWVSERIVRGVNLTEAVFTLADDESFVRAAVYDKDRNAAWSNLIKLK